ncbi:MAG: hypothetical protein K2J38_03275 [Muribaculaceae bacterium]|nr:hypothetical protein [Muribaculaceae bacterium]
MKQVLKLLVLLIAAIVAAPHAEAQTIVRKKNVVHSDSVRKVIISGDTVPVILPERNFGRFDRGLYNYIFAPRGKWGFGITASFGELQTEDIQVLSILKDFDFKGKIYSINPSVQYFFTNNQAIGMKFNYSRGTADLNNMSFDFDEDLSFSIKDVSYYQQSFGFSTFYRTYIGLDQGGRFSIFNDVDLSFGSGSSRFKRLYADQPKDTRTSSIQGALNFSPGVCVFIQENAAFNISFGVFGLKWRKEHQITDGIDEGSRVTSGANFRFNIFNINFGLMVVI